MSSETEIQTFVGRQLAWVELERQAEIDETRRLRDSVPAVELERRGLALLRLRVVDDRIGLGGRTILSLAPTRGDYLPTHRFTAGDVVTVGPARDGHPSANAPTAVVARVDDRSISLALDRDLEEALDPPLRVDRVANDVTYRRLREALEEIRRPPVAKISPRMPASMRPKTPPPGPARRVREVAFGLREPQVDSPRPFDALDPSLDPSQRAALELLLATGDIGLLHGPPGTGKTTTIVELIRQCVRRGEKVLACATSNVAVDNLAEKLVNATGLSVERDAGDQELRLVRLGHPARLLPSVLEHSLDACLARTEAMRFASEMRRELGEVSRRISRTKRYQERRALIEDSRRLRKDLREVESVAVREVLVSADVILATNVGAADDALDDLDFDLVVLDEAAQALEPASWISILRAKRVVLAGDHLQLPPTILSQKAAREGFSTTLFERLHALWGDRISRRLERQYRMHEKIMSWSSNALYDGALEADESVRTHRLIDLPHVGPAPRDETELAIVLIDTAGCDLEEEREAKGSSRSNPGEAAIVVRHVETLLEAGVTPGEIAVITPYNAQVERLRSMLSRHTGRGGLEIGSVDGFQGREKEAVVISMVRSNPRGEVGFLAEKRRMNVAVTRARRHVAIIGDSATVGGDAFLASLFEHAEKEGDYRSAWEYR